MSGYLGKRFGGNLVPRYLYYHFLPFICIILLPLYFSLVTSDHNSIESFCDATSEVQRAIARFSSMQLPLIKTTCTLYNKLFNMPPVKYLFSAFFEHDPILGTMSKTGK